MCYDEYFLVLYGRSKEMAIIIGADLSESAISLAIPAKSKRFQKISGRLRDYLTTTTIGKNNIDSESTTTEDKMWREFYKAGIDTMQLRCQALIARAFVSQLPQKLANALDVFENLGGLKEAYSERLKVVRKLEETEDNGDGNVLQFWRHNRHTILYFAALTRRLVSIPATSATTERLFLGVSPDSDYDSDVEEKRPQFKQNG
ncbi:hypothetical protein QYM36_006442 [Artemia franciscana]|uniref:HAT C-terminal dimerisation domain-containing protein n=1 Tax=Artemia franciscana TaxID=6661 RepID=A0AA88HXJ7_ARTSF|nr:hypothetical protein QYM36_006442 [Artemia franciscana]